MQVWPAILGFLLGGAAFGEANDVDSGGCGTVDLFLDIALSLAARQLLGLWLVGQPLSKERMRTAGPV